MPTKTSGSSPSVEGPLSLLQLREFAVERHGGQLYGDRPYVVHLDAVAALTMKHKLGVVYDRAAYGHDLLEDTPTTQQELVQYFGPHEAALIAAVSGYGANRRERRQDTLRKLSAMPSAINLKMADRIANLTQALADQNWSLASMYYSERHQYSALFLIGLPSLQTELKHLYFMSGKLLAQP